MTVAVTPASSIVVTNALTGEEITSTDTQRTNTLTVALGGDIYNMMRFTAQGSIDINDNFGLDYLSAPVQTTCAQLIAEAMLESTEMWEEIIV